MFRRRFPPVPVVANAAAAALLPPPVQQHPSGARLRRNRFFAPPELDRIRRPADPQLSPGRFFTTPISLVAPAPGRPRLGGGRPVRPEAVQRPAARLPPGHEVSAVVVTLSRPEAELPEASAPVGYGKRRSDGRMLSMLPLDSIDFDDQLDNLSLAYKLIIKTREF